MTNAEYQQKIFWELFQEELLEQNNPFDINSQKHFATINKHSSVSYYCLCVDFMYRSQCLRVGIYMRNNIPAFNEMYANKENIEELVGFPLEWVTAGQKKDYVRRIKIDVPFSKDNIESYRDAIKKVIVCVKKMKEVFPKFSSDQLFDY